MKNALTKLKLRNDGLSLKLSRPPFFFPLLSTGQYTLLFRAARLGNRKHFQIYFNIELLETLLGP